MNTEKTEEITLEEYRERQKQSARAIPIVSAKATVSVFDKDGSLKSTLEFTSEDAENATE